MATPGFVAGGNITPLSFVKWLTTSVRAVVLATDGSAPIVGVTGKGHRLPPVESWGLDDGFIAKAGENVELHDSPEIYEVQYGGTVTRGDPLMSDSSGHAITATTGNWCAGYALDSGVSGTIGRFKLEFFKLP
jgi:Uncharacterized conserved protein (DUF2190)